MFPDAAPWTCAHGAKDRSLDIVSDWASVQKRKQKIQDLKRVFGLDLSTVE